MAAASLFAVGAAALILGCGADTRIERAERPARSAAIETAPPPVPVRSASQAQQAAAEAAGLRLELDAPRKTVELGEPVSVITSVINLSTQTRYVQDLLAPELGFLQIWIQPPDGPEILNHPVTRLEHRGKAPRALAPGERLSALVPIYFGTEGWTVTRPGEHRIRAQYSGPDTPPLESNPVTIIVQAPANAMEGKASAILLSREVGMFLVAGRDPGGEGSRRLELVAAEYGRSHLAAYARLALAVADSRDGFDPETKSFRTKGCERATPQLAESVPEVKDPLMAARGAATWVRCLRELGRDAEASRALSAFFDAHPEAKRIPAVSQMIQTPRGKQ